MAEVNKANPFKKLLPKEEVPQGLKEKVMTSIHLALLMGEVGELFTTKMGETASRMVIVKDPPTDKNPDKLK